jgi:hypothetical protein
VKVIWICGLTASLLLFGCAASPEPANAQGAFCASLSAYHGAATTEHAHDLLTSGHAWADPNRYTLIEASLARFDHAIASNDPKSIKQSLDDLYPVCDVYYNHETW